MMMILVHMTLVYKDTKRNMDYVGDLKKTWKIFSELWNLTGDLIKAVYIS